MTDKLFRKATRQATTRQLADSRGDHRHSTTYSLKGVVDDLEMLEVIIGEEVELVEEITYINTTQWIHLREWQNAGEPAVIR